MTIKQLLANLVIGIESTLKPSEYHHVVHKADVLTEKFPERLCGVNRNILFTPHAVLEMLNQHDEEVRQAAITRAGKSDSQ